MTPPLPPHPVLAFLELPLEGEKEGEIDYLSNCARFLTEEHEQCGAVSVGRVSGLSVEDSLRYEMRIRSIGTGRRVDAVTVRRRQQSQHLRVWKHAPRAA